MLFYFLALVGLIVACGLPPVVGSRGFWSRGVWASHCSGFSCCGVQTGGTGPPVVAALGRSRVACRLSCSVARQVIWDQALKSGFLTTGPPGKPQVYLFLNKIPKLTEEYRKPYVKRHYNKWQEKKIIIQIIWRALDKSIGKRMTQFKSNKGYE